MKTNTDDMEDKMKDYYLYPPMLHDPPRYIVGCDPYTVDGTSSPTVMKVTDGICEMVECFNGEITEEEFEYVKNPVNAPKNLFPAQGPLPEFEEFMKNDFKSLADATLSKIKQYAKHHNLSIEAVLAEAGYYKNEGVQKNVTN